MTAFTKANGTCNVYDGANSHVILLLEVHCIRGVSGSALAYLVITGEDCEVLCSGVSHTDVYDLIGTIIGGLVLGHGKGVNWVHPRMDPLVARVVLMFPTAFTIAIQPLCRWSW